MADLTPNNREEYWLKGMVDGQTTLEPNKRREYWYKEIVDAIGSGGGGGTGGGALIVHDNDGTLDKTHNEIATAVRNGSLVVITYIDQSPVEEHIFYATVSVVRTGIDVGVYAIYCVAIDISQSPAVTPTVWKYKSETGDGYPVMQR